MLTAGCAASESAGSGPRNVDPGEDTAEALFLDLLVVDSELVPVELALVSMTPGPLFANTTADGRARFGPLAEGDYAVTIEKAGYAPASAELTVAQSPPERMIITLVPVALDVPFH